MLLKSMSKSFDGMRGENQFLRLAVAGLLFTNLLVSCSALNRDEVITVVPPTLIDQAWVSKSLGAQEYVDAWAMYLAMMLGNVTPGNAQVVKQAIGPLLDPAIYQDTMKVLDTQIHQIRQDRVSLGFEPQKVLRDNVNGDKLYVTGKAVSEGPAGDKKRSNRTYEFELKIRNYKPVLTWISTNTGNARTAEVVEREQAKQERQQARDKQAGEQHE